MLTGQTKVFMDSLLEFDKHRKKPGVDNFEMLIYTVSFLLGIRADDNRYTEALLENRIRDLVENQRLDEDFLIMSLCHLVADTIDRRRRERDSTIRFMQRNLESDEMANMHDRAKERIDELTQPNYLSRVDEELKLWNGIVERNFSEDQRKTWEFERM